MSQSSVSPKPSISVAFALVNSSPMTESAARETQQQISTAPSRIETIVENLDTRGVMLKDIMEKMKALVAEKEELLGQLAEQRELAQEQAEVIEELQEQRNHIFMLVVSICAGLFFVIFGHSCCLVMDEMVRRSLVVR